MEDFQIEIPDIEVPDIEVPEIEFLEYGVPEGEFCDVEMDMDCELEMEAGDAEGIEDEEPEDERSSRPKARNPKRKIQQTRQIQQNRQLQYNCQMQHNCQMPCNCQMQYNRPIQQNRQMQYNHQMQQNRQMQYNRQDPRKIKVKEYLCCSVFTVTFCNCLFLGLAALIFSLKSMNRKLKRDVKGAKKFSRRALVANMCAILTTIITIIVASVYIALGFSRAYRSYCYIF